jgi:hypothetical protein
MSSAARVQSIDALERFRAALGIFAEEAGIALGEVSAELARFLDWLEHDQLDYWKHELRRREDLVVEARLDLSRCLSTSLDPERTPSCHDEKKRLQRAKERVVAAEGRLAAVRHWIGQVRQAAIEYRGRTEGLTTTLDSEIPQAAAHLDRLIARIGEYWSVEVPTSGAAAMATSAEDRPILPNLPEPAAAQGEPTEPPPRGEDATAPNSPLPAPRSPLP